MAFAQYGRLLRACPLTEATTLLDTLAVVLDNALTKGRDPASDRSKYLTLKASNAALRARLFSVPGGPEVLAAAGFTKQVIPETGEAAHVLPSDFDPAPVSAALEWVRSMREDLPTRSAAPCLIQIKLATGSVSIVGAFDETDTIGDVYTFVASVTRYVKSNFVLCTTHPVIPLESDEWLRTTVIAAGLAPRSALCVQRSERADGVGAFTEAPGHVESVPQLMADRAEAALHTKRQQAEKRRQEAEEHAKALLAFKSDREDVAERVAHAHARMTDGPTVTAAPATAIGPVALYDVPVVRK